MLGRSARRSLREAGSRGSALSLQLHIAVAAFATLCFAALAIERKRTGDELAQAGTGTRCHRGIRRASPDPRRAPRQRAVVSLRRTGNELTFSVHDAGNGFEPAANARGAG